MAISFSTAVSTRSSATSNQSVTVTVNSTKDVIVWALMRLDGADIDASNVNINSTASIAELTSNTVGSTNRGHMGYGKTDSTGATAVTMVGVTKRNTWLCAAVYAGVDTTTPFGTTASKQSSNQVSSYLLEFISSQNDWIVNWIWGGNHTDAFTTQEGMINRNATTAHGGRAHFADKVAGGSTDRVAWAFSTAVAAGQKVMGVAVMNASTKSSAVGDAVSVGTIMFGKDLGYKNYPGYSFSQRNGVYQPNSMGV